MEVESEPLVSNGHAHLNDHPTFCVRFAFGVGHVLNDLCSSMWFTYLLVFFHLVLGFDNWEAGFLLFIGQVADAISNPFVGYLSDQPDNHWLCKYGRRKIWHLIGTVCTLISFPCIFLQCVTPESSKGAQMFYFSVFIIIFQFGWAAVQIAHLSLIPELSVDEHDRTKLAAIRYFFTVSSNVFVYGVAWYVLGIVNKDNDKQIQPSDAPKFQIIVWSSLAVGMLCTIIFHSLVKEKRRILKNNNENKHTKTHYSILQIFSNIEQYKAAGVYMSTMLFVNLLQVFVPLYLNETLNMAASALALVPLVMYVGSMLTSLIVERLNYCMSRKIVYIIGTIIGLTACVWIQYRSDYPQFTSIEIYIVSLLYGCASAVLLVTNLGVTADTIGTENENGAFIYGLMCFTDKLSNGIAVFIIQYLHKTYATKMYYGNVLTYVCGGAIVFGTFSIICIRKKNKEKFCMTSMITVSEQQGVWQTSMLAVELQHKHTLRCTVLSAKSTGLYSKLNTTCGSQKALSYYV